MATTAFCVVADLLAADVALSIKASSADLPQKAGSFSSRGYCRQMRTVLAGEHLKVRQYNA